MFYRHGSSDSLDKDVFFVVDTSVFEKALHEKAALCKQLSDEAGVNGNLIAISEGVVTHCFKGTVDEVNNGLLDTYGNHSQLYPLLVEREVKRDVGLKVLRTTRGLLSFCSRTQYRAEVKAALRSSSLVEKGKVLCGIDLGSVSDFEKSGLLDTYKFFAFQLAQTLALLNGFELYTKWDAARKYPDLEAYLYRKETSLDSLKQYWYQYGELLQTMPEVDGVLQTEQGCLSVHKEVYV